MEFFFNAVPKSNGFPSKIARDRKKDNINQIHIKALTLRPNCVKLIKNVNILIFN